MRDDENSSDKAPSRTKGLPKGLLEAARARGSAVLNSSKWNKWAKAVRRRLPGKFKRVEFDFKKVELQNVSQYSGWIRWGLILLAIFLLSQLAAGVIGIFIRPTPVAASKRSNFVARSTAPSEDYDSILRRNMFNVEGKIPDPFDQGQLDCLSQARPSTQRIVLLGTIVMNNEMLSVALIQEESNPLKIAVKKDDVFFDGKYQAMKVERKKFCFQVRASQEFEFVEIPDDSAALGLASGGPAFSGMGGEGISAISETEFVVSKKMLDDKLGNLNEILQTARAVPYMEPGTGKFKGFLIQSIDPSSPFAQRGVRQGDVLTGVNDIVLDNAGKGLEAFQKLRNSPKVSLEVIRGGQKTTMSYDVK